MKKPHVLNRSMFSKGGTSAYGRGITSNLVSDEQRQRFNYGGRVGFDLAGDVSGADIYAQARQRIRGLGQRPGEERVTREWEKFQHPFKTGLATTDPYSDVMGGGIYVEPYEQDIYSYYTGESEVKDAPKTLEEGRTVWEEDTSETVKKQKEWDTEMKKIDPEYKIPGEIEEKIVEEKDITDLGRAGTGKTMPDSDTIDWTEFAEGLYDKKGAKGKALLGLAGNVLAASQQPKKEAAVLLGKGIGDFGKTFVERKEKMEDIAATGKMYEAVNVAKAAEAGKWALKKAYTDAGLTGNIITKYNTLIKTMSPDSAIKKLLKPKVSDTVIRKDKGKGEIDFTKFEAMAPGSWTFDESTNVYYVVGKDGKSKPIGKVTDLLVAIEAATK